jgi:hypothetical protein
MNTFFVEQHVAQRIRELGDAAHRHRRLQTPSTTSSRRLRLADRLRRLLALLAAPIPAPRRARAMQSPTPGH